MTTRPLNRPLKRPNVRDRAAAAAAAAAAPVPSFVVSFPPPYDHGVQHPLYEFRLAANRVYQARKGLYKQRAGALGQAVTIEYVRKDVLKHLLDTEAHRLGPFTLLNYVYLEGFRAWLPFQRVKAEALYDEYRSQLLNRLTQQDLGPY
jgi:hypothetical protein